MCGALQATTRRVLGHTVALTPDDGQIAVRVSSLPGVFTWGATIELALACAREAIELATEGEGEGRSFPVPPVKGSGAMANRSAETPQKESDFQAILRPHLPATNAVMKKHDWAHQTYLYVDITPGPGRYDDGLLGSPAIFFEEAERLKNNGTNFHYQAWFIEKHKETAARLCAHLASMAQSCGSHRVYRADHNDQAAKTAAEIGSLRGRPFGLVYADCDNLMIPLEAMRTLAVGRMDLLVYLSATTIKRVCGVYGRARLEAQLWSLGKQHIWLREPSGGHHRTTFALLSNWGNLPTGLPRERFPKNGSARFETLLEELTYPEWMREQWARERKEALSLRLPFPVTEAIAPTRSTSLIRDSELSERKL